MPEFIVEKLLQGMVEKSINIPQSKVLILVTHSSQIAQISEIQK